MKREIRQNAKSGKFVSRAEVETNPEGTITQTVDDYWQRRCAAAEKFIETMGETGFLTLEQSNEFQSWRDLVDEKEDE